MISQDIKMGLLHKLIANPEIDTAALSPAISKLYRKVFLNAAASLCYLLTMLPYTKHKENRAAEVVKALL